MTISICITNDAARALQFGCVSSLNNCVILHIGIQGGGWFFAGCQVHWINICGVIWTDIKLAEAGLCATLQMHTLCKACTCTCTMYAEKLPVLIKFKLFLNPAHESNICEPVLDFKHLHARMKSYGVYFPLKSIRLALYMYIVCLSIHIGNNMAQVFLK